MGLVGDWVVSREEFRVLVSACVQGMVYPPKALFQICGAPAVA